MRIELYQVDAFTDRLFGGNPAAVCPLNHWLDDDLMQAIARENNLSETAFFVPDRSGYHIRWFTPTTEVDLCGHATLASAYVIFTHISPDIEKVAFKSRSGTLLVRRRGTEYALDFPAHPAQPIEAPQGLAEALGSQPGEVLTSMYHMVVFDNAAEIVNLKPDVRRLQAIGMGEVIVTAEGDDCDFVSRFFAPGAGIDEDPVTGSAHTVLTPYWSRKLQKKVLSARQVSARGGKLTCEDRGDRVLISGSAVQYMHGQIEV